MVNTDLDLFWSSLLLSEVGGITLVGHQKKIPALEHTAVQGQSPHPTSLFPGSERH